MLSFNQFFMLLESRLDKVKEIFKDVSTDHDALAKHRDSDSVVDHFATNADPTHNKAYTQWIMNQYKRKNIRQEDSSRIHDALTNFDRYKSKLQNRDLNSYKHISDLEDAVEPHLGKTASNKEEKRQIKSEGAELLHSGNGVTVHHLKTKNAACQYGSGTKWCTASNREDINQFDNYSKDGPLLIVQHDNRKYQLHVASNQFKDERDIDTNFNNVHKDIASEMAKAHDSSPAINDANYAFNNPVLTHKHLKKDLASSNPEKIKSIVRTSAFKEYVSNDEFKSMLNNDAFKTAIQTAPLSPEHAKVAMNYHDIDVRAHGVRHADLNHGELHQLLTSHHEKIREATVMNKNADETHYAVAVNDPSHRVRTAVAGKTNDANTIDKLIKDPHSEVLATALNRHYDADVPLSHNTITQLLNSPNVDVQRRMIERSDLSDEHITQALSDSYLRDSMSRSKHMPAKFIEKTMHSDDNTIRRLHNNMIQYSNHVTDDQLTNALKSGDSWRQTAAVQNKKLDGDTVIKHLNHLTPMAINSALYRFKSKKVGGLLIKQALQNYPIENRSSGLSVISIAKHPAADNEDLATVAAHPHPRIRMTAVKNKNLTNSSVIDNLLNDNHPEVRHAALHNNNANIDSIRSLAANDESKKVRDAASVVLKQRGG